MEELPKCKYCNYSNSNLIELNNHHLTCYKKYINEILLKNSQIDNFVKSVKKRLLDTLTKLDEDFEQIVNNILDDYVALHHKLELIKIDRFSKNGTVGTMNRLNKWIKYIKDNKAFNENQLNEMKDLFFLVDRNFLDLEKIKDDNKKEVEDIIQEFYPHYKLDKISIIENLKKQIQDLHIDKNQTVTFENLQTHTLNAIIFAYKDYYNVGLVPEGIEKENGFINQSIASNPFFKLVNNLKHNRSDKVKFSNDIYGNKISKKDFKYFENYLLFDSYSIIEDIYLDTNDKKNKYSYSTKSFLGRKLYIFYEDASRQSGEFKKLKEDLQARDEAIKTKKITLSKRTNELLSNEKEFLKQMLRIRFDREKNIYYII